VKPVDTPRLQLRALCEDDEALYCRIYSSPQVMRHVGVPLSTIQAAASFAVARRQNATECGSRWWVAVLRESMEGIGLLGTIRRRGLVEVGVMLLPQWQGRAMAGLMRKLRFEHVAVDDGARWEIGPERWRALRTQGPGDFAMTGRDR
jgi:RimJ/RimL family protein N-acetyltransferase